MSILASMLPCPAANAAETNQWIWPQRAPGETSGSAGEPLPAREGEQPPVTRVVNIRRPSVDIYLAAKPNGTAIVVLPGGGFRLVVPDKEGNEAAEWLNDMGISVFVLRYRSNEKLPNNEPPWKRPLQDAQRTIRMIRSGAKQWNVNPNQVGVLAFSAGGQVGAILHTRDEQSDYEPIDEIDKQSCKPNFSLLVYPWQILVPPAKDEPGPGTLLPEIQPAPSSPPAFIVHTHDDRSSSIGSVLLYAGLKQHGVMAELHVYENGGHGYGMRPVKDSNIGTWPDRAGDWLQRRGLGR